MSLPPSAAAPVPYAPVLLLAVAQLVSWGSLYYAFALFIGPLERELGWSRSEVTLALTMGLLATALASPLAGRLIDRVGGRLPMTVGSLAAAALLLLWAATERLLTYYLVWIGLGLCMAFVLYDAVFALLARVLSCGYRRAVTLVTLVAGFASTVFLPLTHLLVDRLGWRGALVVLALLNLAVPAVIHLSVPRRLQTGACAPERHPVGAALDLRAAARGRAFWGILVAITANSTLFSAVTFHAIPLLRERGLALGAIVAAMTLVGPAQVAARLALLALERRASLRVAGVVATGLPLAATLLLARVEPGSALLWLFPVLYGAGNGMVTIVRASAIAELLGRAAFGAINGAIALPALAGIALAPVGAALLWGMGERYDPVLTVLAGLGLTSVAGMLWATTGPARP